MISYRESCKTYRHYRHHVTEKREKKSYNPIILRKKNKNRDVSRCNPIKSHTAASQGGEEIL